MSDDSFRSTPSAGQPEGALGPYLRAIGAHKFLVALCALIALGAATAWLSQRSPTYETSAEMLVTPLPSGDTTFQGLPFLRDYGEAARTIQTAAALVQSPTAAGLTAGRVGEGATEDDISRVVEVLPQGESSVLSITAKAETAERAALIANTYAQAALDVRRETLKRAVGTAIDAISGRLSAGASRSPATEADLEAQLTALEGVRDGNDPTLSISQRAPVPTGATGKPKALLAALALIGGLVIGTLLALLLELTDRRLRDEEDLLRVFPAPILARVPILPRRLRSGSATQLTPAAREAFRTLRVRLEQGTGHRRAILVTSASSGDGKTTSAINLALALIGAGHRVLLIDFDLRKPDIGARLGVEGRSSLVATLGGTPLGDVAEPVPGLPPLRFVTAATSEGDVALLESLRRRLPDLLDEARELADYVVIDSSPLGEVSDALTIAGHADEVLVVIRPGHTNRINLETVRELLEGAGHRPTGSIVIGQRAGAGLTHYTYGQQSRRPGRFSRAGR